MCRVLEVFGLGTYAAEFEEQGYDDVEFLFKMSPSNIRDMLKDVKMKKRHGDMYRAAHKVWKNRYYMMAFAGTHCAYQPCMVTATVNEENRAVTATRYALQQYAIRHNFSWDQAENKFGYPDIVEGSFPVFHERWGRRRSARIAFRVEGAPLVD